jgi:hypothetical protein
LRSVERERNRKVVTFPGNSPAAAGDFDAEHGRQRLCATVPHAWQVRFWCEL